MLEVGKLYVCEEYFLLLFPDQETVGAAYAHNDRSAAADFGYAAAYWSNRFGKPVFYIKKNIPLLVLNSKENFSEVLAGDRKGWIVYQDWLKIKEIE